MKTNPLSEVLADRACASCQSGTVQNQVRRFIGTDNRGVQLCNSCLIELRRRANSRRLCAFCGRHAKYATWELEKTKGLGVLTFSEGSYIPEYWLLCEKHFDYMHQATKMRVLQKQLTDYSDANQPQK